MPRNSRPIKFLDYLPEIYRTSSQQDGSILEKFLEPFETIFEEVESAIEGDYLSIRVIDKYPKETKISAVFLNDFSVHFPSGTKVTAVFTSQVAEVNVPKKTVKVKSKEFLKMLKADDLIRVTGLKVYDIVVLEIKSEMIHFQFVDHLQMPLEAENRLEITKSTCLKKEIMPGGGQTEIFLEDAAFIDALGNGDILTIDFFGGIPELMSPSHSIPYPVKNYNTEEDELQYLKYLAGWMGLSLRADKPLSWNRNFFKEAVKLYFKRSTVDGMENLLREWLKGDIFERKPPLQMITDLSSTDNGGSSAFQIGVTSSIGFDTVLGEGPPHFFIVDLITNPASLELRNPVGLDAFQRNARFLIDSEKPAHTRYQLRVKAHTMQLAPKKGKVKGEVYAQLGVTSLLWDGALVYEEDEMDA
ncbi:MAG: hypothetical protein N2645_14105 [Clostridia bacterium]|nr:hypothetical protein [Clostridia bacterium]